MKECVFWDSEDSKFINWEEVSFTKDKGDDFVIVIKEIDHIYSSTRLYDSFDYIGLNDISNNKIYADCSIVEFDFLGFGEPTPDSYKAFVKWNKERFRYDIQTLSRVDKNNNLYVFDLGRCIDRISNIKIIDTIQENKLGLIKE